MITDLSNANLPLGRREWVAAVEAAVMFLVFLTLVLIIRKLRRSAGLAVGYKLRWDTPRLRALRLVWVSIVVLMLSVIVALLVYNVVFRGDPRPYSAAPLVLGILALGTQALALWWQRPGEPNGAVQVRTREQQ